MALAELTDIDLLRSIWVALSRLEEALSNIYEAQVEGANEARLTREQVFLEGPKKVDIGSMPNVTVNEPVSVDDGGGSLTVDGTVAVSGTVPVTDNGGSLTVDGTVSVSNLPAVQPVNDNGGSLTIDGSVSVPGVALEATLAHTKNRFAPNLRTTEAFEVTASGDNTVRTPAAGKKLRVHWVGMSSPDGGTERLVVVKFGAGGAARYRWYMGAPGAFSHWETIEGAADEALVVNLSGAATVQVNLSFEEI